MAAQLDHSTAGELRKSRSAFEKFPHVFLI